MTRSFRLLMLVIVAATLGGCASTLQSPSAAAPEQAAASDLDSLTVARSAGKAAPKSASADEPATSARAQAPAVAPAPVLVGGPPPVVAAPMVAVPPTAAFEGDAPYRLDTGDRLRIVVFGQEGLSNSYVVDSSGMVSLPLIKAVRARGLTTGELARAVADRLRQGFVREPHVAIEVDAYRPFFILGEVIQPGQYAYVPHLTVENAIAIAGGFTPRAYRWDVKLDRPVPGGVVRNSVPMHTRVRPGDTIVVKERWF